MPPDLEAALTTVNSRKSFEMPRRSVSLTGWLSADVRSKARLDSRYQEYSRNRHRAARH
jgi:hypothetical protein